MLRLPPAARNAAGGMTISLGIGMIELSIAMRAIMPNNRREEPNQTRFQGIDAYCHSERSRGISRGRTAIVAPVSSLPKTKIRKLKFRCPFIGAFSGYYQPFWGQTILGLFFLAGRNWPQSAQAVAVQNYCGRFPAAGRPSARAALQTWVPLLCLGLVVIQFAWGIINWITKLLVREDWAAIAAEICALILLSSATTLAEIPRRAAVC